MCTSYTTASSLLNGPAQQLVRKGFNPSDEVQMLDEHVFEPFLYWLLGISTKAEISGLNVASITFSSFS